MTANRNPSRIKTLGLPVGLAGALAVALVAGTGFSESVVAKPSPDRTAAGVQKALKKGKIEQAITLAEQIVAANPREPSYRTLLAQAYMRAGRFESATTTFNDAMKLGDNSARTALALSLAQVAQGRNREAVALLDDWRDAIPAADLGLALALAGETTRGVAIIGDAMRSGESNPKLRQNLAYALALDGRWREARVMVEQDVPGDLVDDRISEWAARAKPEDHHLRVAGLLNVPVRADPGQPTVLALADNPTQEQLAAETAGAKAVPALAANGELPPASPEAAAALAQYQPVDAPAAAPAPQNFDRAFAHNDASQPVVQPLPADYVEHQAQPEAKAQPKKLVRAPRGFASGHKQGLRPRKGSHKAVAGGTHLVQLGSFLSQQGARRAWGIYAAKNPELKHYRMTITQANVRGKNYWRVSAGGLNSSRASGLCSSLKSRGGACFAYAIPARAAKAPAYAQAAKPRVKVAPVAARPQAVAAKAVAGPASARR
jgi:Flp pilus assembly protein TadD